MKLGIFSSTTDYGTPPHVLARACEERGFESFWVPEHSHIPASRASRFPGGGELPKDYSHLLDPFVALSAAAAVTTRIRLGTAVCLVAERDPIHLANEVASLDHLSGGRFIFGIGGGWNEEETANHGVDPARRWAVLRERVAAMKTIWRDDEASYEGEHVRFDPIWAWPKPVQKPHPPILLGVSTPLGRKRVVQYCNGWLPVGIPADLDARIEDLREKARAAGRDPADFPVSVFWAPGKRDKLQLLEDLGVERAILSMPAAPMEALLPRLDHFATLLS